MNSTTEAPPSPHAAPQSAVATSALGKGLSVLGYGIRHPGRATRAMLRASAGLYRETVAERSPIPTVDAQDFIGGDTRLELLDFVGRNGNVSLLELTVLAAAARRRAPRTLVEIGTFDGNTALQLALNSPADARMFTLDLPPDPDSAVGKLEAQDLAYITDERKQQRRKYAGHAAGSKVTQWLGDSATFDFAEGLDGRPIDLAFIDGSHSYDYVRRDTESIFEHLAPDGLVFWHDYTPAWPGVIRWLDALATQHPLRRIEGTTLIVLER